MSSQFNNWIKVGSGATGIVYKDPNSLTAVKISDINYICSKNKREYNIIKNITDSIPKLDFIHIVTIYDFFDQDSYCYMLMEYIPPLININGMANQIFFADIGAKIYKLDTKRGWQLGYQTLIDMKQLTLEEVHILLAQMSQMIAYIHYQTKYDGFDIEYIISSDKNIYLIDFEQVTKIENFELNIKYLAYSLINQIFFPQLGDSLFPIFEDNYLMIADQLHFGHIARAVIAEM